MDTKTASVTSTLGKFISRDVSHTNQLPELRVPNAGSFIRPSTSICYGISFLQALSSRYIELLHDSGSREQVVLGSSGGAIRVEAVNLDKIRGKFSNLLNLREISVDGQNVATSDPEGEMRKTCPSKHAATLSIYLDS